MTSPTSPTHPLLPLRSVLVTGAAGFIAGSVRGELSARGIECIGLDRLAGDDVDIVADLVDVDLDPLLGDVDAVIHLAGTPGVQSSWADGFDLHVRNNLVATQRLCEAAVRRGGLRLVVASSSSVYGSVDDGAVHEDRRLTPLSPYGASKAATEHLLSAYAARGVSVTPLRYFTVFGPGQRPDMAIHRMFRAALDGPAFPLRGDGSQARSFSFVDDVARATVEAAARDLPSGSAVNVGGTEVVSVIELLDRIGELTGVEIPIERLPTAHGDPARTAADIARASAWLGWSPTTSIDDGLAAQWAWHRRVHHTAATADAASSTAHTASTTSPVAVVGSP